LTTNSKLWKRLERRPYATGADYLDALSREGFRVSDWIDDVVRKPGFRVNDVTWPLPLVRVRLDQLGFSAPTTLEEVYRVMIGRGYENPPPEAALALRFVYPEQPVGEWLRVATPMNAMVDRDGVPHLPKLGHALGKYFLETYWSYPGAVFHPHNEFVLVDRRCG